MHRKRYRVRAMEPGSLRPHHTCMTDAELIRHSRALRAEARRLLEHARALRARIPLWASRPRPSDENQGKDREPDKGT